MTVSRVPCNEAVGGSGTEDVPCWERRNISLTPSEREIFFRKFEVPTVARPVIDAIVTPLEQKLIAGFDEERFTTKALTEHLPCRDETPILSREELSFLSMEGGVSPVDAGTRFVENAYRRGILFVAEAGEETGTESITKPDCRWRFANFYTRLDVFVVAEQAAWRCLPVMERKALDDWYFDAYYAGLDWEGTRQEDGGAGTGPGQPSDDRILTLQETLTFLDENEAKGRRIYLTDCDCRSLKGACDSPTRVCLSYRDGPNTYADRGISLAITHMEAKAVVVSAERAGLVHTVNGHGICNCCEDCCYLFRAAKRRGSAPHWPLSRHIVTFDAARCVGCGNCLDRCRFGVFDRSDFLENGTIPVVDDQLCVGCAICVNDCPADALRLAER